MKAAQAWEFVSTQGLRAWNRPRYLVQSGGRRSLRHPLVQPSPVRLPHVPELILITGEQPAVAELSPQDARGRFQLVFSRFIGVFARSDHPLALFLDDLQWLDAATLDLLEHMFGADPDPRHLLLIGAYRDNEVTPAHPLMRMLDSVRSTDARLHEMVLEPLARDDLASLVADSMCSDPTEALPLVNLVHEKTGGNPFFVIQFLSVLAEEGLLTFEHRTARWTRDPARISGLTLIHRRDGKPYTYDGLCAMLKRRQIAVRERHAAEQGPLENMPSWGFYDMKGKGATDMWLSGVPLEQVQVLCGHDSVTTTERYVKSRWRGIVAPNKVSRAV